MRALARTRSARLLGVLFCLGGTLGVKVARAQLILEGLVPGGEKKLGIGGWPFEETPLLFAEQDDLLALSALREGRVILQGSVEDVARRSVPPLRIGCSTARAVVKMPAALCSVPGGVAVEVLRSSSRVEFGVDGPGGGVDTDRYRAEERALSLGYAGRPVSFLGVGGVVDITGDDFSHPSYRFSLGLGGQHPVSMTLSAGGCRSDRSLRLEHDRESMSMPLAGSGRSYGAKILLRPGSRFAVELEEYIVRDDFSCRPGSDGGLGANGIARVRERRASVSRALAESAAIFFLVGDWNNWVRGTVSEDGVQFAQGEVELRSREWAVGIRFAPSARSRWYSDLSHLWLEGRARGSLEVWPFTTGMSELFGSRFRVEGEGSLSLTSLHVGGEHDLLDPLRIQGGIRYIAVDGGLSFSRWQPAFLGFGRRDETTVNRGLQHTSVFVPSVGASFEWRSLSVESGVAQFIPVRGIVRPRGASSGESGDADAGEVTSASEPDSRLRGGTVLAGRVVYHFASPGE